MLDRYYSFDDPYLFILARNTYFDGYNNARNIYVYYIGTSIQIWRLNYIM